MNINLLFGVYGEKNLLDPMPSEDRLSFVENLRISAGEGSVLFHNAIDIKEIGLARFVEMIGPFMAKFIGFKGNGTLTDMEYAIHSPLSVTINNPTIANQVREHGLEQLKDYLSEQPSQTGLVINTVSFNSVAGLLSWQLSKCI